MSIAVKCDNCHASFQAKDEHAGKRGKCPKCQAPIVVPKPEPAEELIELPVVEELKPEEKRRSDSDELIALPAIEGEKPVKTPAAPAAKAPPARTGASPAGSAPVAAELIATEVVEDRQLPPQPAIRGGAARSQPVLIASEVVEGTQAAGRKPRPKAAPPKKKTYAEWQQEVLAAFTGAIEPVDVPFSYRFAAGLVAVFMVLLPFVYAGVIGLVCYAIYFHATHSTGLFSVSGSGRAKGMAAIIYFAPLLAGPILIFFMLKPLFARPARSRPPRELTAEQEPLLFAFIERLCQAVGAPLPKKIVANCEVNASASFRKGFLSIFLSQDLVLTIGLPLVAGLNLRQFSGVLAHEFGHFTQGAGLRLTYVIRTINHWFVRVVYERDAWDERLENWAKNSDSRIGIFLQFVRLLVWLTRRVLWLLMLAGQAVSGYLLRQMEYHADRHEARFGGSHTFAQTARRLPVLSIASRNAYSDLQDFYRDGRLGDNLPKLIMANVGQFSQEVLTSIDKTVSETKTGIFDTHPADKDRIANAAAENAPGMFRLEVPASVLFRDFDTLSRQSTWDQYLDIFDGDVQLSQVHPVDELIARQERDIAGNKAIGRFFQGSFTVLRPLPVSQWSTLLNQDAQSAAATLKRARDKMLAVKDRFDSAFKTYDEADTVQVEAGQAEALLRAKMKVKSDTFSQPLSSAAAASAARSTAANRQMAVSEALRDFEHAAAQRIMAAARLLREPRVAAKIDDIELCQWEADRCLPALGMMNRLTDSVLELRNARAVLGVLLGNWEGNEENGELAKEIHAAAETASKLIDSLHGKLASESYPFDHAKGEITMAQFVFDTTPSADDIGGVWQASEIMVDQLFIVDIRLVGRMAYIAEQVETAIGLPLLPDPPQSEGA